MTASGGNLIGLGFVAPGNRASVLDFSEEQAAASGNQSEKEQTSQCGVATIEDADIRHQAKTR